MTIKTKGLDKFLKTHHRLCSVFVFSGHRICSCGRDDAEIEVNRMREEIARLRFEKEMLKEEESA